MGIPANMLSLFRSLSVNHMKNMNFISRRSIFLVQSGRCPESGMEAVAALGLALLTWKLVFAQTVSGAGATPFPLAAVGAPGSSSRWT